MAIYVPKFNRDKKPSTTDFYNQGADSAARKFITPDAIQNNSPTDSTSNSEHIIKAATGFKTLAAAVQAVAIDARSDASAAVRAVLNSDADADPVYRDKQIQYTEEDVNTMQKHLARSAVNKYNKKIGASVLASVGSKTYSLITDARHTFIPVKSENAVVQTINTSVPQIENVAVDLDPRKGATDAFYVGITFNIKKENISSVKMIRVFRATVKEPIYTRPVATLSSVGIEKIAALKGYKNSDNVNMSVTRLEETGVQNAVTNLGSPNPFTGLPNSANMDGSLIVPPPLSGQSVSVLDDPNVPEAFHHLDKSVIENINVLFNLQNNPVFGYSVSAVTSSIPVGANYSGDLKLGRAQRIDQQWNASNSSMVVDSENSLMFSEIAHFSPDACFSQQVGNFVEYYFADDSVTYGGGYKYFVVTIDDQMAQSSRSSIVDAVVEVVRVPPRPTYVDVTTEQRSISLAIIVNDQLIEKFEIHRMDTSPHRKQSVIAEVISGQAGFSAEPLIRNIQKNNFVLIGEALNSLRVGCTFIDRDVVPGNPYVYRVYSVDIFGNKSESPFEVTAFVSDRQDQFVPLKAPSILAEVDSKTKKIKITFNSNEPLVQRMRLERKDLTTGEQEFSNPSTPSRIILGYGRSPLKNRNSLQGELLAGRDPLDTWTGFFQNTGKQQIFIDQSVQFDHIYQYRIYGEDRYGNRTSYGLTSPLLVIRKPFINAPVNLTSVLTWDDKYKIQGVQLTWGPGSLDVSAADKLGNQTALSDSSVRTLYQVQRKLEGSEIWENFPLTENVTLFDALEGVNGDVSPNFRPSFLKLNERYSYRVQAVQIGAFISNFTDPVSTFVGFSAADPEFFILRTPDSYTRPFYIMLNWDTPTVSGVVDRWDIERCELNNFAAGRFNINNPQAFKDLQYKAFRSVYRESSRFSGREVDIKNNSNQVDATVISGEHYYMDNQVEFGNSYFYRIRAVDSNGNNSGWVYKAIKLTDQVYENKWVPIFSDEEKKKLALSLQPQTLSRGVKRNIQNSMGLLPSYCAPDSSRTNPRISYDVFGNAS